MYSTEKEIPIKFNTPTNNSKKVKKNGIFFAIKGERENGTKYINDAIKNGATAIVTEKNVALKNIPKKVKIYFVPNVRKSYAMACKKFFSSPDNFLDLCGITGTNGKTSISYLLIEIWGQKQNGLIGTIESRFANKKIKSTLTTPDAFELNQILKKMVRKKMQKVFLEVSSHSLELSRVEGINFDSAIFTNLSREHLDFHKNMSSYYKSKSKLFLYHLTNSNKSNKIAVINIDDIYGKKILDEIDKSSKCITYSIKNKKADFYLKSIDKNKSTNNLIIKNKKKEYKIQTNLFGQYNYQNILAAFTFSITKGLSIDKIRKGIKKFNGAPGRLEKIKSNKFNIYIDYAHTPDALKKSIVSLKDNFKDKFITVLFGCGGDRDKGKRKEMGNIAANNSDKIIITSDNPRNESPKIIIKDIVLGINSRNKGKVNIIIDRKEAIKYSIRNLKDNEVLLIAGKGHEDYQEIRGKRYKFSDKIEVEKCLKIIN